MDYFHFSQGTPIPQDCTFLCQRILEFLDNVARLIVLKEANDCIEQEQAGNDTQVDPVLQARSQHECQLKESCQPKLIGMKVDEPRCRRALRFMDYDLQA